MSEGVREGRKGKEGRKERGAARSLPGLGALPGPGGLVGPSGRRGLAVPREGCVCVWGCPLSGSRGVCVGGDTDAFGVFPVVRP